VGLFAFCGINLSPIIKGIKIFIDLKNGASVHADFVRSALVRKANGKFFVLVKMRTDNSSGSKIGVNRMYEIEFTDLEALNSYTAKYFQMEPLSEEEIQIR
jgi:hypothetical protein